MVKATNVISPASNTDENEVLACVQKACEGLSSGVSVERITQEALASFYPGVPPSDMERAKVLAARAHIEKDPDYSYAASRLLLATLYAEAREVPYGNPEIVGETQALYSHLFVEYIQKSISWELLDSALGSFDLARLGQALRPVRDLQFKYLGLQTLYDRYFLQYQGRRIELPQFFWMRVAMGLALREKRPTDWAISFYELMSTFRFCPSTPTLFNAGTPHPQLSSCYLTTVDDDLGSIFKSIQDNALLSKWSGGLGNDWTRIRALGSHIKGTNGTSQGVIPFLKVANDTAVAVNQGGKRKGAVCAYLETWHLDIEEFLELRKNTGDERRRTHDMNTANWIPDLFIKRVMADEHWTLFSPSDVPDLHNLYGRKFERRYLEYEEMANNGLITLSRRVQARDLWKKMITMLFETGHPWITFKDPSNVRSPQDHVGVIHSSNLCTEILLNTSDDEVAVCNLGSVNLVANMKDGVLDLDMLQETVNIAVRMLDNVIDINFYPIPEAREANWRHRPIGLGLMGFQDALYAMRIPYDSHEAVEFADRSAEALSYFALWASSELARERGRYSSFEGSKWHRGYLPLDTLSLLDRERDEPIDVDRSSTLDWEALRERIRLHGLRNSNTTAIAPTATIANIVGTSPSIEPTYRHLYVKSNLSGEFTVVDTSLIKGLQKLGRWDGEMLDHLKYYDGSIQAIPELPQQLRDLYKTAFEIDPYWLIEAAARRQKWIDMSQSLNLYTAQTSGTQISEMYLLAWRKGLKTTYYLRSQAATQIEKSTMDVNKRGFQPRWMRTVSPSGRLKVARSGDEAETCEVCQ